MNLPHVVSPAEWESAHAALLVKEKQATRARDALAAKRRRLPMVRVEQQYAFEGPDGRPTTLADRKGKAVLATMGGGTITATKEGGRTVLTDAGGKKAAITQADQQFTNGVVHQIDGLLLPGRGGGQAPQQAKAQ